MITKAEILWTRTCPLSCSYCNMATGEKNSRDLTDWMLGIDQLKQLDCSFIAFYGAECLADFKNLPEVVGYAEESGIDTTVITSGYVPDFKRKLKVLHNYGAKSISMSYDINPLEKSSSLKTSKCVEGLKYFKSLGNIRDVAAIATVTKSNYQGLLWMIEEMSEKGIWTFFDLVHPDLGHPGSKCKGENKSLLFETEKDREELIKTLEAVLTMKKQGFLVHCTDHIINTIKALQGDIYSWCCAKYKEFPSWVTIDCDGSVIPCDDFHTKNPDARFDMTSLSQNWQTFTEYWKREILLNECSCCWGTHIGSHAVKAGVDNIEDYIHGKNNTKRT